VLPGDKYWSWNEQRCEVRAKEGPVPSIRVALHDSQSADCMARRCQYRYCGAICVESTEPAEKLYSFMACLASGNGTNPEELLAAAHASCFTMSVALSLQAAGYTPAELSTEAVVTLEPDGASIRATRSPASR